jgi:hypothetical protein
MEIIRKIYIKSEADLPKEPEKYFVKFKNGTRTTANFTSGNVRIEWWLENIDWYLQPDEQPEIIMPTMMEAETKAGLLVETILKPTIARHRSEGFLQCYDWFRDEVIKRNKREIE